jgi:hypothetical protein
LQGLTRFSFAIGGVLGDMDRVRHIRLLEQIERYVILCQQNIDVGENLLSDLSKLGFDMSRFEALLGRFKESQRLHVLQRERLMTELKYLDR